MNQHQTLVRTFTVAEAASLTGLSRYMVDYLCRQQILQPSFPKNRSRGKARRYLFGDIVMLKALSGLLSQGVSVHRLKKALKALREHHNEITLNALPAKYLVTNGRDVYFRQNGTTIESLDKSGQFEFAFVLELESIRDGVTAAAKKKKINLQVGQ